MLQAKQKEVLYVRKELAFECPHCGMKYILYAVLGENEDRLNQEYVRYCPYCGAKYLETIEEAYIKWREEEENESKN